ncbi:DUF1016 N-terminal domain-containing protein [Mycobacterium ostraviense]|uniref:DUF1016 N-terminal domain-containing protein n=1 Tax=Mycobacterium ostraviense TaxID=2738409 RepID=UPI000AA9725B|nr:DUF1016 N-terminal domain-containing protein [Mycobacterium ostraviense]UGT89733.1 DUF1016 N-terminal domain-containing protein [Mycobacterium ostraviense]
MNSQDEWPAPANGDGLAVAPKRSAIPNRYPEVLDAVTDCVKADRQRAVSAANQELVGTYWAVGGEISAHQHAEGLGARVNDRLAAYLRERFPDTSGFSPAQPNVQASLRRDVVGNASLHCAIAMASPHRTARECRWRRPATLVCQGGNWSGMEP